jgi:hypothetical protein
VQSKIETYRAKAKEFARLTVLAKSLRHSRQYRKLAEPAGFGSTAEASSRIIRQNKNPAAATAQESKGRKRQRFLTERRALHLLACLLLGFDLAVRASSPSIAAFIHSRAMLNNWFGLPASHSPERTLQTPIQTTWCPPSKVPFVALKRPCRSPCHSRARRKVSAEFVGTHPHYALTAVPPLLQHSGHCVCRIQVRLSNPQC